jgi:hypothetical protein
MPHPVAEAPSVTLAMSSLSALRVLTAVDGAMMNEQRVLLNVEGRAKRTKLGFDLLNYEMRVNSETMKPNFRDGFLHP